MFLTLVSGCNRPTEAEMQAQKQPQIEDDAKAMAEAAALKFANYAQTVAIQVDEPSDKQWPTDSLRDEGDQAFKAGKYAKAYAKWFPGAAMGDLEQQELIADLLLGPHAHAVKRDRHEGTRFLYRAAIGGRRTAMLSLSDAINKGSFGLKSVPAAAECWSKAPSSLGGRSVCVGLTEFEVPRARASCSELPHVEEQGVTNEESAVAKAKLCLANNTPALLVPGPPPGAQDTKRTREYARYGIEWRITGDVYEEEFEQYREKFNATMVEGIEAKHGRGYLERLSKEIEEGIKRRGR